MKRAIFAVLLAGCTTNNYTVGADGGAGGCPPNTKQCVSSTLSRVCPSDGSGWLAVQCNNGETCDMTSGDCTLDVTTVPCNPGDALCTSATMALTCNANGMGYMATTCPTNTTCVGNGTCAGACVVGESKCDSATGNLLTCADGNTFTPMACPANQLCVALQTTPFGIAQCLGGACLPDANGCDTVCGNKLDTTAVQTNFISQCVVAADGSGWKWQVTACSAPATCDPIAGSACPGFSGTNAACATQCTPGAIRCSADFLGTQICDPATGQWGAVTACDATKGQVCQFPSGATDAVCGDSLCAAGAKGTCVAGQFAPCTNGVIGTPAACASGICVTDTSVVDSLGAQVPGAGVCQVECQMGDQRCAGLGAIQACATGGVWASTTTACTPNGTAQTCFDFKTTSGRPNAVCGVCAPGTHQCVDAGGVAGAGPLPNIETCDATGAWGASTACTVGACDTTTGDGACIADCVPSVTLLCSGVVAAVPGTPYHGSTRQSTCNAQGRFNASTACAAGSICRKDAAGNSLGCVVCVGGQNEAGLSDTRCSNTAGTAIGTAAVQSCTAGAWAAPPTTCAAPTTCHQAVNTAPPTPACGACANFPFISPCTDSTLAGFGASCAGVGEGAPMSCGTTPDCCGNDCALDPATIPQPAACGP
jgi:hypothetical protein